MVARPALPPPASDESVFKFLLASAPSSEKSLPKQETEKYDRPPNDVRTEAEKFPSFLKAPQPVPKAKSMTEAEMKSEILDDYQIDKIATQLKTADPPLSLEQARQRRESIKEERKRSIDFIRRRTMSRASALGRPNLDALGHPNLEDLAEGKVFKPRGEEIQRK
ncbi:hypothetical protein LZ554_005994 [Drepanopeziza brunnea f. sp. 'monogermtubi']|nr:hypothetical protein LZ554_005994 [Drepanopeziza brunnea f. sp. 'monogermtubi']